MPCRCCPQQQHRCCSAAPTSSYIAALQHAQRLRVHQALHGQQLVPLVWLSTEFWPSTHSAAGPVLTNIGDWAAATSCGWYYCCVCGGICQDLLASSCGLARSSRRIEAQAGQGTKPLRQPPPPLLRHLTTLSKHTHTQRIHRRSLAHRHHQHSSRMQTRGIARSGIRGTPVVSRNARRMAAPVSRGAMSIRAEKVRGSRAPASCSCSSTTSSSRRGVHGQAVARRAHLDCVRAGGGH